LLVAGSCSTSAPAATSNSTTRVFPLRAANMSAVHLPQSWLAHPTACQRLRSALPILGGDVNAGGNELLDWARVPSSRRLRERSPPSPGKRH
jgi:hypothetical protein